MKKLVYSIVERDGKTFWSRIGEAFVNRDGSLSVTLESVPLSGQMQIRSAARPIGEDPSGDPHEQV
jgi:hypothetical protein